MKVFVTGGSSPLGELVLPRLAASHDVYALTRSDAAANRVEQRGASAVHGSLEDARSWVSVIHNADAVVHLAGIRLVGSIVNEIETEQPLTVISSASVRSLAHPQSAELRAAESHLNLVKPDALVLLRPTMIFGSSGDRNVRLLARLVSRLPAVPRLTGGGLIQPVLADDVADAVANTLGTISRIEVDLGGPVGFRLGDLIAELARLFGKRRLPIQIPVRSLALFGGLMTRLRPARGTHALAMLRHDRTVEPPPDEILGHPPTPLSHGLRIALARYRLTETP